MDCLLRGFDSNIPNLRYSTLTTRQKLVPSSARCKQFAFGEHDRESEFEFQFELGREKEGISHHDVGPAGEEGQVARLGRLGPQRHVSDVSGSNADETVSGAAKRRAGMLANELDVII